MFQKKSLGQHFLRSEKILDRIIVGAALGGADTVLEVGPGEGALTARLLEKAGRVIAVEKDDRLIPFLEKKFSAEIGRGALTIVRGDILNFPPGAYGAEPGAYKIVANLPYYISGQFLRTFLSGEIQPERAVLLLQREVVDRILAADGKESLLSLSVKCYGRAKKLGNVPRRVFRPVPKADSAILLIEGISKEFFAALPEARFFETLRAGFAHKRKLLSRNLEDVFGEKAPAALRALGIPDTARAEELSLTEWQNVARSLLA